MRDADDVPVAALLAGEAHGSARRRAHGRAGGRRDVDPVVVPAPARAEGRRDRAAHRVRDRRRAARLAATDGRRSLEARRLGGRGAAEPEVPGGAEPGAVAPDANVAVDLPVRRRSSWPACSTVCSTRSCTSRRDVRPADGRAAGGVLLEQRAPGGEPHDAVDLEAGGLLVAPHGGVGLRTEHAVGGDSSAFWTSATSSPSLPSWSGSPPSRISIARLAGDSAATAALTSPETCAAAIGAAGPATTAVASAADTCFLRLFSRRALRQELAPAPGPLESSGSTAQARPDPGGRASSMSPSVSGLRG